MTTSGRKNSFKNTDKSSDPSSKTTQLNTTAKEIKNAANPANILSPAALMALGLAGSAAAALQTERAPAPAPKGRALNGTPEPSPAPLSVQTDLFEPVSTLQQQLGELIQTMGAEVATDTAKLNSGAIATPPADNIQEAVQAGLDLPGAPLALAAEPVVLAQAVTGVVAGTQGAGAAAAGSTAAAGTAAATAGATAAAATAAAAGAAAVSAGTVLLAAAGIGLVAAVGSGSKDSGSSTSTKDTTAPASPVINAVATDNIVNAAEKTAGVTVTGTAEAGATVVVSWGTASKTVTATGGTWSATFSSAEVPADASTTISAVATDAAGNASTAGTKTVTVDTSIAALTVALTTDTGTNTTDKLTSNAALSLSTAASDVTRSFKVDGGASSASYTAPTADGAHTVVVTDTDTAGNTASASLTFTLDKTIATPTVALTTDTGTNTTDKLTSNAALTLSTAASDVTRSFTVDGGAASANYTAPSSQGSHTVVVTDIDAAGNTASASLTFTLDTVAPEVTGMTAKKDTSTIDLAFDGPLDGASLPAADAFVVTQGTTPLTVSSVTLTTDGSGVRLTLTSNLVAGFVKVKYTDPTLGNDAQAVQDAAGNDSLGFISGIVADGYVRGASVYIDTNNNGKADPGVDYLVGTTDANGNFFIPASAPSGSIIAVGGVNIDTGVANTVALKAPEGSSTINPLTTMVQAVVEQQVASGGALTPELINAAASSVAQSLGLDR
ncbi:MAG: Ig-like domain-containing protein, partial [Betaproteobacteria bacterium]